MCIISMGARQSRACNSQLEASVLKLTPPIGCRETANACERLTSNVQSA